ncbi:hypothetical protein N0V82_008584 [Gnomoniopsis sp. IMI 355080]|nr:hypothetical protein N0V82_008584 [Gnomoniopsis sp. IMI 355080]
MTGKEGTAAKRSGNGNAPVLEVDENSEHDVENELPRQVPGRHVRDHAKRGVVQQNNAHVIDKTVTMTTRAESTENARATSDRSARLDSSSSSLHGRSRTRRRSKLEYDIGNKHEEQAMITGNSSDTATDLEAENAPAPPPTASAPGLHEDTIQQGLKRAPELATTSTISNSFTSSDEKENACPPARKAKRRLTLHDTQSQQQKTKKRKVAPRQTVQTTLALAIGGNAGMRECKVCDTVYNPFHPEDVKVHAKRHAGVVRKERRTVEL